MTSNIIETIDNVCDVKSKIYSKYTYEQHQEFIDKINDGRDLESIPEDFALNLIFLNQAQEYVSAYIKECNFEQLELNRRILQDIDEELMNQPNYVEESRERYFLMAVQSVFDKEDVQISWVIDAQLMRIGNFLGQSNPEKHYQIGLFNETSKMIDLLTGNDEVKYEEFYKRTNHWLSTKTIETLKDFSDNIKAVIPPPPEYPNYGLLSEQQWVLPQVKKVITRLEEDHPEFQANKVFIQSYKVLQASVSSQIRFN